MICQYEKTIFKNEENGYCIFSFSTEENTVPKSARNNKTSGKRICFTGVGYHLPSHTEVDMELIGKWEQTGKYGTQFMIEKCVEHIPKTKEGLYHYFSSGAIKGIGKSLAKSIVETFGEQALDILEKNPQRYLEIKGITAKKLIDIQKTYLSTKDLQEIVSQLAPFQIGIKKAMKIQQAFGSQALEVIKEQPYKLCDIKGFGFLTVDEIAHAFHAKLDDPKRIKSCLYYVLETAGTQGHLFLPAMELLDRAYTLLNHEKEAVAKEQIKEEIRALSFLSLFIAEKGNVYLPHYYTYEREAAEAIVKLIAKEGKEDSTLEQAIKSTEKKFSIVLSASQKQAIKTSMQNKVSIITGGPGTGKTTVLKVILSIYQQRNQKNKVLLLAPTGRASRRMAESTGYEQSSTIHKALGLFEQNKDRNERKILDCDFVIVDEVSMLDMYVAKELFTSLPKGTKLLLVGDVDQLPSVGAGNVFREMILCEKIPVTILETVFRQAETSSIALNAHKINQGEIKLLYDDDFVLIQLDKEQQVIEKMKQCYLEEVKKYGIEGVQILTPFKSRSNISSKVLNEVLQDFINPKKPGVSEINVGFRKFRLGDKVMQIQNKEYISNGEMGFITGIQPVDKKVQITFSDNRVVVYGTDDLSMIELAYAITIHKSQGCEYSSIILPMLTSFYIMLKRNLLYTAVTRGKQRVTMIGQKKAIVMAIKKADTAQRNTLLKQRIQFYFNEKNMVPKAISKKESYPKQIQL